MTTGSPSRDLLIWLIILPEADPKTQANTMMVASLGRTPKNMMSRVILGPPPPNPAKEQSPEITIIKAQPRTWDS